MQRRIFKTSRGGGFETPFSKVDLSKYTKPQNYLQQAYEEALQKQYKNAGKAFKVTFKDQPDLIYIAFKKAREKAVYEACKYFKEAFYPTFMGSGADEEMKQARATRVQELDKFALKGKVPIPELMRIMNFTFPCSVCGKDNFNYEDYEIGRCFMLEGEGDLNPFTSGYVLCYDCYKKYIQTN